VVPLTPAEVVELKQHFAFLREYKKTLRLRLNAHEDLLLNGAREPMDRGVCQHLLAKVELSRVAAVTEHLDAAAATSLLQGIVRFSRDIGFLLLYLDSVRRSSSQADAAATLAVGLKQIDFAELSAAQLRRVLDLVVEVFDDSVRPEVLLGLLASKSFRRALEESVATLPEALARYLTPLRAVQSVVLRGAPNTHGARALRQGVELLLGGTGKSLGRQPSGVRERLFELGLTLFDAGAPEVGPGLAALLASFRSEPARHRQLALEHAGHFLAAGRDEDARRVLTELSRQHPDWNPPRRWLEALEAPRIGRVALVAKAPRHQGDRRPPRFRPGFWLDRQLPVLVAVPEADEKSSFAELIRLWQDLVLPGIAPLLLVGETAEGLPYLVVPQTGKALVKRLAEPADLARPEAISIATDLCRLLAMLARIGVYLPDGSPGRFAVDETGRTSLFDLVGALPGDSMLADRKHLEALRQLLGQIRRRAPGWVLSPELEQRIDRADDTRALGRALLEA
jgi:flagellar biosynthesis regulator FlbT